LDHIETGAPVIPALTSDAPVLAAVEPSALEIPAPEPELAPSTASAVDIDAVQTRAPDWDEGESSAPDYVFRRKVRIREATTVQDGHSLAEQAVYDAMYRAGKPYQGESRILT